MNVTVVVDNNSKIVIGVYDAPVNVVKKHYTEHFMEESGRSRIYVRQAIERGYTFTRELVIEVD